MDFIESEGAVSGELTSVRLTISEKGRPLRVKRVANSREIRWRKPVKSQLHPSQRSWRLRTELAPPIARGMMWSNSSASAEPQRVPGSSCRSSRVLRLPATLAAPAPRAPLTMYRRVAARAVPQVKWQMA